MVVTAKFVEEDSVEEVENRGFQMTGLQTAFWLGKDGSPAGVYISSTKEKDRNSFSGVKSIINPKKPSFSPTWRE